jgi:glycosyltransferase involved in cell wall biosynthesis
LQVRRLRAVTGFEGSRNPSPPRSKKGLVCLAPPASGEAQAAQGPGMVSELASWLHRNDWPVEIVAANSRRTERAEVTDGPEPGSLGRPAEVLGMGYRMRRLDPWLVHSFDTDEAAAAEVCGAPYVLSLGQVPPAGSFACRPLELRKFEGALRGARGVICTNRRAARLLLEGYGFDSYVIPEGVDAVALAAVPVNRESRVVLCPSEGIGIRDLELLIDAFVMTASESSGLRLVLAGSLEPGGYQRLTERTPVELRRQVALLDNMDHRRLVSLIARASVVCCPGPSPVSGRVLVESLGLGAPVVCADGGSGADVLNEDAIGACAGLRFTPRDTEGCARSILRVLELSSVRGVAESCRSVASLYDWSFIGPRLVDVYRRATA